jgi:hypothetical protein
MDDRASQVALQRHWDASDAGDFEIEHEICREDAALDYPQSGERIHGRRNIRESRFLQPNKKSFSVRRILGGGDLWITEFVLSYDGVPSYAVSIMEFAKGRSPLRRNTSAIGSSRRPRVRILLNMCTRSPSCSGVS